MRKGCSGGAAVHLFLIALLGLLAYSNTFDAPFQWDEQKYIAGNPLVRDLAYFLEPSRAEGFELYPAMRDRYIGYLTFALNYLIHGLDVTGYHAVNIAIHVLNALLLYLLVLLTFRTPFLGGSSLRGQSRHIALLAGLLFVSHPVQTEAVTYIFQRLASLVALFYLASVAAYAGARLAEGRAKRYVLYGVSLLSAVLAMKTKENAFTLPLAITLYEFLFFGGPVRKRMLRLVPFLLTMGIIPFSLAGTGDSLGEIMGGMARATEGHEGFTRWEYLLTQFRVVVTYIRLLFLPVGQNFGYDYPVFGSLLHLQVSMALLFHVSLLGLSGYLLYLSRQRSSLRLAAFGILWFYLTLSVESSIIPIPMPINEYRVYLPSAGAFAAFAAGAFLACGRLEGKKTRAVTALFFLLPVVLSAATYSRNAVWQDRVSLWEDTVRKSPRKAGAHINLAHAYYEEGKIHRALNHLHVSQWLEPGNADSYYNLGHIYEYKGDIDSAIKYYEIAIQLDPYDAEKHFNIGNCYRHKGQSEKAIKHLWTACYLMPDYARAHFNLGILYMEKKLMEKARREFETVLRIDPRDYQARIFLSHVTGAGRAH